MCHAFVASEASEAVADVCSFSTLAESQAQRANQGAKGKGQHTLEGAIACTVGQLPHPSGQPPQPMPGLLTWPGGAITPASASLPSPGAVTDMITVYSVITAPDHHQLKARMKGMLHLGRHGRLCAACTHPSARRVAGPELAWISLKGHTR